MPNIHPVLVHLSIALLIMAVVCEWIGWIMNKEELIPSCILIDT